MTSAEFAARSRANQGLAVKVEDEAVLLQVAGMILALLANPPARRARKGGEAVA